jgi:hypothetical protein
VQLSNQRRVFTSPLGKRPLPVVGGAVVRSPRRLQPSLSPSRERAVLRNLRHQAWSDATGDAELGQWPV